MAEKFCQSLHSQASQHCSGISPSVCSLSPSLWFVIKGWETDEVVSGGAGFSVNRGRVPSVNHFTRFCPSGFKALCRFLVFLIVMSLTGRYQLIYCYFACWSWLPLTFPVSPTVGAQGLQCPGILGVWADSSLASCHRKLRNHVPYTHTASAACSHRW